jgi:hypothetical protein
MENTEEIEKQLTDDESQVPLVKAKKTVGRPKNPPKIKEKKPRTEKQVEAFAKAQQKIKENNEKRKEAKKIESAKLLLANGIELPSKSHNDDVKKAVKLPAKKIEIAEPSVEEEEVENEIIYVKQPRKTEPKPKKKRKIIVYQDQSSDDSSSEEEQEVHIKSKKFKTQQNKKSLIKIGEKKKPEEIIQQRNFFCD